MGDGIQAAKAGILEIADVFVVNKADRDGADQTVRDLRYMQSPRRPARRGRRAGGRRSCKTVARASEGIDDVVAAIEKHRGWLESTGELARRRRARGRPREIEAIALADAARADGRRARLGRAGRPRRARSWPGGPTPTAPPTS